jgi:hypothetical protein
MGKTQALRKVNVSRMIIFKVKNRRSYAAICLGNLCEGNTPAQAFGRLKHPLRRMGYALPDRVPSVRAAI